MAEGEITKFNDAKDANVLLSHRLVDTGFHIQRQLAG